MFFGQFWQAFGYLSSPSNWDSIIKQDNLTLEKLLDTESIVNESKLAARKFIEFMEKNPQYAQQTIEYAIRLPDIEDNDEKKLYKYPFVASEIFGAQISGIESLFYEEEEEEEEEEEDNEGHGHDHDTEDKEKDDDDNEDEEDEKKNEEVEPKEEKVEDNKEEKIVVEETHEETIKTEDQTETATEVVDKQDGESNQTTKIEEPVISQQTTEDIKPVEGDAKLVEEIAKPVEEPIKPEEDVLTQVQESTEKPKEQVESGKEDSKEKEQSIDTEIAKEEDTKIVEEEDKTAIAVSKPKLVGKQLLNTLLSFLDTDDDLNDTSAGYFFKIVNNIFSFNFMRHVQEKPIVLEELAKHIRTKGVSEVILKVLTYTSSAEIDIYLDVKKTLLQLVVGKFENGDVLERENIAHVIHEVVQSMLSLDKKQKGYGLLSCIEESEQQLEGFFKVIVNPEADHSSVGFAAASLGFIVAFYNNSIHSNHSHDDSSMHEEELLNGSSENTPKLEYPCEKLFAKYIPEFVKILLADSNGIAHVTSFGQSVVPLGVGRLKIVELIGHLFKSENRKLIDQLAEQDIFKVLLELMIKYPWNNLLHISIEKVVLEGINESAEDNSDVVSAALFGKFNLLQFIVQNAEVETGKPGLISKDIRLGYVGFLTGFAKKINDTTQSFAITALKDDSSWKQYVDTRLKDILERESRSLGANKPKANNEEPEQNYLDDNELKDIHKRFASFFGTSNQYESGDIEEVETKEEIAKEDVHVNNKQDHEDKKKQDTTSVNHEDGEDQSNTQAQEKTENSKEMIAESNENTHEKSADEGQKPVETQDQTTTHDGSVTGAEQSKNVTDSHQHNQQLASKPKGADLQDATDVQELENQEIKSEFIAHELWKQKVAHDQEQAKPIEKLLDEL